MHHTNGVMMLTKVATNCALFFRVAAYLKSISRNWHWLSHLRGIRVSGRKGVDGTGVARAAVNYAVIFCARFLRACGMCAFHTYENTHADIRRAHHMESTDESSWAFHMSITSSVVHPSENCTKKMPV